MFTLQHTLACNSIRREYSSILGHRCIGYSCCAISILHCASKPEVVASPVLNSVRHSSSASTMAASEAALILKYFGRAVSVASTPIQGQTSRVMGAATIASTMQRLSDVSCRRPVLQAHTELSSDASRALAFLQMHGSATDIHSQDSLSSTAGSYSALCQQNSSERHGGDRRYRNAGQTLQMMGVQNVANFSTQHQWLQARANLDLNAHPMIRARSGIPATHLICP